jgi:hypothetical protein
MITQMPHHKFKSYSCVSSEDEDCEQPKNQVGDIVDVDDSDDSSLIFTSDEEEEEEEGNEEVVDDEEVVEEEEQVEKKEANVQTNKKVKASDLMRIRYRPQFDDDPDFGTVAMERRAMERRRKRAKKQTRVQSVSFTAPKYDNNNNLVLRATELTQLGMRRIKKIAHVWGWRPNVRFEKESHQQNLRFIQHSLTDMVAWNFDKLVRKTALNWDDFKAKMRAAKPSSSWTRSQRHDVIELLTRFCDSDASESVAKIANIQLNKRCTLPFTIIVTAIKSIHEIGTENEFTIFDNTYIPLLQHIDDY